MDNARAIRMAQELRGSSVGGWVLGDMIGAGKSALVFAATKGKLCGAVKVFDPELIERFGNHTQEERIKREVQLGGHNQSSLIQILGGGRCDATGHLFVAMERLDWPSLDEVITEVPRERIRGILKDLATAARFLLEEKNIAHRDIKPSNIIVDTDFNQTKLLDLGVMKPIAASALTDDDYRVFIGTLQYSSPEFLLREEKDTTEGWTAVTFYQLGAVLHDLIMRRPIFQDFTEPFANLVHAIRENTPQVLAEDVDPDLVLLARNCLTKSPELRLSLVSWDSFQPPLPHQGQASKVKQRLRQRQRYHTIPFEGRDASEEGHYRLQLVRKVSKILDHVDTLSRDIAIASPLLPPARFTFSPDPERYKASLHISFTRSYKHALTIPLNTMLLVNVLDPNESVVCLTGAAAIGDAVIHENPPKEKQCSLFEGVYEQHTLKERVDIYLHTILDEAQKLVELDDQEGPQWLNVPGGES